MPLALIFPSQGRINDTYYKNPLQTRKEDTFPLLVQFFLEPECLVLPSLLSCYSLCYRFRQLLNQPFLFYVFYLYNHVSPVSNIASTTMCVCVCVSMYLFMKLHVTAQSCPVIYSFYATACNPPGGKCVCACVRVCVDYAFIKLHITTQSGPVILLIVILCHSHSSSLEGFKYYTYYEKTPDQARQRGH